MMFGNYVDALRMLPFIGGWFADKLLGDPEGWPHPIVWFGRAISAGEKQFNRGENRADKGALMSLCLVVGVYGICKQLLAWAAGVSPILSGVLIAVGVFYFLSGTTLIREVKAVFEAVDRSTEEGRKQVARIVGRDTAHLSPQEIRAAALETLAENLSDGVIAPMFWFALLGLPGMAAYKMVNTLDSMIGYNNDRYNDFGWFAAHILDDGANYVPARLTAFLMISFPPSSRGFHFVHKYASRHSSPNSGYPESALAGILNCRFGGSNTYDGKRVEKPYIGKNYRELTHDDVVKSCIINIRTSLLMLICTLSMYCIFQELTGFSHNFLYFWG